MRARLATLSDGLAVWGTRRIGSMPTVLVLMAIPLVALAAGSSVRYAVGYLSSSWFQLWALAFIMVGQDVLDRQSTQLAIEQHDEVKEILADQRQELDYQRQELAELRKIGDTLDVVLKRIDHLAQRMGEAA